MMRRRSEPFSIALGLAHIFGFPEKGGKTTPVPANAARRPRPYGAPPEDHPKKRRDRNPDLGGRNSAILDPDHDIIAAGEMSKARARERRRCRAILFSAAGAQSPALAMALAFESAMTRREAIAFLERHQSGAWSHLNPGGAAAAAKASWDVAFGLVERRSTGQGDASQRGWERAFKSVTRARRRNG